MKLERERWEAESKGAMTSTQWAKENVVLRHEMARLRMENRFLGKASVIDASRLDSRVFRVDGRGEDELPDHFDGSRAESYSGKLLRVVFLIWGPLRVQRQAVFFRYECGLISQPVRPGAQRSAFDGGFGSQWCPRVDKKTAAASLCRQGLRAASSRVLRHPRFKDVGGYVYENSYNRQWDKGSFDRIWITSFVYLRSGQGWVCLVVVHDAHTKRAIGYAMGVSQVTGLVRQALNTAYACRGRKPVGLVLHADRGCQLTSRKPGEYIKKVGLTLSMGRTRVYWNNAMAEPFQLALETECYYRHAFRTREEVYEGVSSWAGGFYNRKRLCSSISMMPPVEYELRMSQTAWKQAA